uniref:Uncharacterized protein n=1 Tax=Glossina pallidipes TaxID=7398 RepID=A0A1A9ZDY4_GLOPL
MSEENVIAAILSMNCVLTSQKKSITCLLLKLQHQHQNFCEEFINRFCYNQPNQVIMTMMVMMMLVMLLTCSDSRNFTLHSSNCSSKNIPNYSTNAAVGVVV